jgi:hypothetical protein
MTHKYKEMSGSKGKDLLMADKVANPDEKSVDAFDGRPSYDEPAEKSAGQETVEELNRGFFYFNDRYLNGYTDNGKLIGIRTGRPKQRARAGTTFWFRARNRWQCSFPRRKVSQQHFQGGGMMMDAGARIDYWVRCNLGLSESAQFRAWPFSVTQTNAQTNVTATVDFLFQLERSIQRSRTSATGSAFGNGGRP